MQETVTSANFEQLKKVAMENLDERLMKLEKTVYMLVELVQSTHITLNEIVRKVDENFTKIEERFKKIEYRLTHIENSLNILTNDTSSNFGNVDVKLGNIAEELSKINAITKYEEEYQNLKIVSR